MALKHVGIAKYIFLILTVKCVIVVFNKLNHSPALVKPPLHTIVHRWGSCWKSNLTHHSFWRLLPVSTPSFDEDIVILLTSKYTSLSYCNRSSTYNTYLFKVVGERERERARESERARERRMDRQSDRQSCRETVRQYSLIIFWCTAVLRPDMSQLSVGSPLGPFTSPVDGRVCEQWLSTLSNVGRVHSEKSPKPSSPFYHHIFLAN